MSIAIAVSRPLATSGVIEPREGDDGAHDEDPGRLGSRVLEHGRSHFVPANMMIDHDPPARETADVFGHVAELVPGRQVEDDRDFTIGQLRRLDVRSKVLEESRLGIEEVVAGRRGTRVHHPHVLALLAQQARHAHFRTEGIPVRPDVRRHQETIVRLDQVGQRCPVDRHFRFRRILGNLLKPEIGVCAGPTEY